METPANATRTWRFGVFEVDARRAELRRGGTPVKVREQSFRILVHLLEHAGEIVTREELRLVLWPSDTFVDFEHSLNTAVMKLRDALGDSADAPLYIETIPKRGYRFIAPVSQPANARNGLANSGGDAASPLVNGISGPSEAQFTGPSEAQEVATAPAETPDPAETPVLAAAESEPSQASPHDLAEIPGNPFKGARLAGLVTLAVGILAAAFLLPRVLNKHSVPAHAIPHPATEQRITSNPPDAPIEFAVVSPDGKYVAYADSTGLYLRDIASGETRPWGVPKDFVASPDSWFPDGTHLLVTRTEGASQVPSLWKLSLLGGSPRMLMQNAARGAVSPDGSRIAYLSSPEISRELWLGKELWLMGPDGTNPRKIAAAENSNEPVWTRRIWSVTWSPHGQRIAYIQSHGLGLIDNSAEDDNFSLQTRDANGGDLQVVSNDPRLKPALFWVADGRILYAYLEDAASERRDQEVRSIQVDERTGKATGQPQIVTHGQGRVGGLSATADGRRLVLSRWNTQPQAFIAEFEAGSRRLKTPRRLTLDANGNLAEAWTRDSKQVFIVSNRNGTWKLFKQAIDETTAEVLVEGNTLFLPRLSADGSQVLYLAYPKLGNTSLPVALMRLPLAGGPPQLVLQAPRIVNFQCARPPSQLCIFSRQAEANHHIFAAFDTEHGMGRELTTIDSVTNWSLSPDGSLLAIFLDNHRFRILSLTTGVAHDVSVQDWRLVNGDWSADGKSIFMPSVTSRGTPVILDVNYAGKTEGDAGKAEVILEGAANTTFIWLVPSPDGRYAILEADIPGDNNVWMVENF